MRSLLCWVAVSFLGGQWDDRTRLIAKSARDLVDQEAPQGCSFFLFSFFLSFFFWD